MKRYYIFDYIWYIGEALRKKDGNPSSGAELKSLYLRLFVIYVVTILFAAIALSLMFNLGFITNKR